MAIPDHDRPGWDGGLTMGDMSVPMITSLSNVALGGVWDYERDLGAKRSARLWARYEDALVRAIAKGESLSEDLSQAVAFHKERLIQRIEKLRAVCPGPEGGVTHEECPIEYVFNATGNVVEERESGAYLLERMTLPELESAFRYEDRRFSLLCEQRWRSLAVETFRGQSEQFVDEDEVADETLYRRRGLWEHWVMDARRDRGIDEVDLNENNYSFEVEDDSRGQGGFLVSVTEEVDLSLPDMDMDLDHRALDSVRRMGSGSVGFAEDRISTKI